MFRCVAWLLILRVPGESLDAGGGLGREGGFLDGFPGGEFGARAGPELEVAPEIGFVNDFPEAMEQDSDVRGSFFGDLCAAN